MLALASELRQITTIESAGSSTRIEGAEISDAEVAHVLNGLSLDSFRARPSCSAGSAPVR